MKDDKFKRVRCLDTATNSIKFIPKHLTENSIFMQNHNLKVQDFDVKKEVEPVATIETFEEEIQATELNFEAPKTEKRKRKAKQE